VASEMHGGTGLKVMLWKGINSRNFPGSDKGISFNTDLLIRLECNIHGSIL
jgi:hypothetical protein